MYIKSAVDSLDYSFINAPSATNPLADCKVSVDSLRHLNDLQAVP